MKRQFLILALAAALCAPAAGAASPAFYGFCPDQCDASQLAALGSGKNAFLETAVCLNPASDPLVASLKGKKITGIKCYLRADYKQKNKGFSAIRIYSGSLDNRLESKAVDFTAGWNEFYFDTPVEIGDEPLYVGYQVFETQGEPFPVASFSDSRVQDVCFINPAREGWQDYGSRGALMVQAIIDADDSLLDGYALAAPMNLPRVVAPGSDFVCDMYVHNQSASPVTSMTYDCRDENLNVTASYTLDFSEPMPPYGAAKVSATLRAPAEEGPAQPLIVNSSGLNGISGKEGIRSRVELYVSSDVFYRIPVVEEFTGLSCTNCPFMFYYLDLALEKMESPHIYVAHHAGFNNDRFTQPCDEQLLYLFGEGYTYNPAVMYDRRVMSGTLVPVQGAFSDGSTVGYDNRIAESLEYPALAKVFVDSEISADAASARVYGRIGKAALPYRDQLYLTLYLLEDRISTDHYPQAGLDPLPDGAPDDLLERFCHRGVIRHDFGDGANGMLLNIDEEGNFDVSYALDKMPRIENLANCEIVAFVHRVNTVDLADNYVLNGGAERFNGYAETGVSGVGEVIAESAGQLQFYVTADRRIVASDANAAVSVWTLDGRRTANASLAPGLYIVRAGASSAKILIK